MWFWKGIQKDFYEEYLMVVVKVPLSTTIRTTYSSFACVLTSSFSVVGYGCMTCIGNSGPLDDPVADAIEKV